MTPAPPPLPTRRFARTPECAHWVVTVNGAGKTTARRMLATLLPPDSPPAAWSPGAGRSNPAPRGVWIDDRRRTPRVGRGLRSDGPGRALTRGYLPYIRYVRLPARGRRRARPAPRATSRSSSRPRTRSARPRRRPAPSRLRSPPACRSRPASPWPARRSAPAPGRWPRGASRPPCGCRARRGRSPGRRRPPAATASTPLARTPAPRCRPRPRP